MFSHLTTKHSLWCDFVDNLPTCLVFLDTAFVDDRSVRDRIFVGTVIGRRLVSGMCTDSRLVGNRFGSSRYVCGTYVSRLVCRMLQLLSRSTYSLPRPLRLPIRSFRLTYVSTRSTQKL